MKVLDNLAGIIEGIDSDGIINQKEIDQLKSWVDNNYELHDDPVCSDIFRILEDILEDNIIEESEKEVLLDFANDYLILHNEQKERMNTLKGIIKGISCDNVINEKEAHNLKRWMKNNNHLSGIDAFDQIFSLVEHVLKDNIITSDEQEQLLAVFNDFTSARDSEAESKALINVNFTTSNKSYYCEDIFDYERRINSIMNESSTIYVIKGIPFYNQMQLNLQKLVTFNMNSVIAIEEYDEQQTIQDILVKIADRSSYVISYEEFNLLPEAIIKIFVPYNYNIHIINNNLFHNYYPIMQGLNKKIVIDSLESDKDTIADRIWEDYIVNEEKVFVSYQAIENEVDRNIEYTQIFVERDFDETCRESGAENAYDFGQTEDTYISTLDDILNSGKMHVDILVGKKGLMLFQKRLLRILSGIGYTICLVKRTIRKIEDNNLPLYEAILKRKNENYAFKYIDFYVEPGISLETQKISQGEIVSALVSNSINAYKKCDYNDIFVTAPTGAGKSVLFQIPAIYLAERYDLLTIVVTPLIGLMSDQLKNIVTMTDAAVTINSEYTPEEKETIKKQLQTGEKSILYVSPETLLSNTPISTLIGDRQIGLLVVDEAHIVTTWGKSFRPDYWYLGDYISKLRQNGNYSFPIATFSATVTYGGTDDMHGDIIDSLKMRTGVYEYVAPMRREDISFDIRTVEKENDYAKEKEQTTLNSLKDLQKKNMKTLAYFPFVRQINDYFNTLKDISPNSLCRYYGGMDKKIKNEYMDAFISDNRGLMLATKAFGMGIDIDNINVVYHFAPTGNLCDYIQEIGRAARAEIVRGIAMTDFYEEDFRYINQLYGMSAINDYHLKAVLFKIRENYYQKGKRNFTISPDDFAYIFSQNGDLHDVDAKLKTAVLMIQKDFELNPYINYKPLIFKPRSMFTKGYFLIQSKDVKVLEKTKYRKYFKLYADKEYLDDEQQYQQYVWSDGTLHKKLIKQNTSYMGNVYVVDFKRLWEDHFEDYTFANFKRLFYNGELDGLQMTKNFRPKYLLTIKTNCYNLEETQEKLGIITDSLIEAFSKPEIGKKHLSLEDIAGILNGVEEVRFKPYESSIVAENFISIINNYKSASQLNSFKPIRYNTVTGKYIIHSQNALISVIKKINIDFKKKFSKEKDKKEKTFLISSGDIGGSIKPERTEEMNLAKFLEAFKLCSYQVVSGERPEYFVRVNSIMQIEKILDDSKYRSKMVKLVKDRHVKSRDTMRRFFTELHTDEERWDYIEKYFVGMEEDAISAINGEKQQIVKHKSFGKGIVIEQNETHIIVEFYNSGKKAKFQYPDIFNNGLMQKLN